MFFSVLNYEKEVSVVPAAKYLFIIAIFLFINESAGAQSFSVGHAVPLWGNTTQAMQVDVSLGFLTTSYIHIYRNNPVDNKGLEVNKDFLALFFTPIINKQRFSAIPEHLSLIPMVGFMNQPYPNENGRKFHFGISLSLEVINHLDLYYKHISNGFFGETNVGIDTIGIKLKIE